MPGLIKNSNKIGGVPQGASRYVAMSTCFDVFYAGMGDADNTIIHIGFINNLTANHSRTVQQIRHLNSVDGGIAVDTVTTPDTPTLSFNGFYVYGNDASNNLGAFTPGSKGTSSSMLVGATAGRLAGMNLLLTLDQQNIPFDIVVRHVSPQVKGALPTNDIVDDPTNTNGGRIIAVYKNCTISNMSIPIGIGNAAISDSGSISVGYIASDV